MKDHIRLIQPIVTLLLFSYGIHSYADHNHTKTDNLLDLSLAELATVKVVSRKEESLIDAPGVVSVISAEDIKRFGARHLRDVINRLPNSLVIGSGLYVHNRTSLRGVTQTHLDDKVLILLNGRPIREAGQGGINGDIYSSFPLELIKQIEVIRGPGSVLYGTNAFAGVINLVTYPPQEGPSLKLTGTLGSFDSRGVNLSGSHHGDIFSVIGSAHYHKDNGDKFNNTVAELGNPGVFETGREASEAVFQINYGDFSLTSIINDIKQASGNNLLSFPSEDWTIERRFFDLGHRHRINEHWELSSNLTYNGMHNTAGIIGGTGRFFITKSRGYLLETTLQGQLKKNLELLVGGVYDHLRGTNVSDGSRNTNIDTWRGSFYSQSNYQATDWLRLSLGFQYNKPEDISSAISPRFATIISLSKNVSWKIMYGEAFRSPFGLDLFLDAAFLQGNPKLKPETIHTMSNQILYSAPDRSFSFTRYHSLHEDLIVRMLDENDQVTLTNKGSVDYEGYELDYKFKPNEALSIEGSISYQTNENDDGFKDSTFHPKWMAKQGISYARAHFDTGIFLSYFSEPTQAEVFNADVMTGNPKADTYFLLTSVFNWHLGHLLHTPRFHHLDVSLYLDNILDEEIYFPEISRLQVNSFPSHAGRGIYGVVSYEF